MPQPFIGLLRKDYRLLRADLLVSFIIMMLALGFGIVASFYTAQPAGTIFILIMASFAMVGFIPIMMLSILLKEGKNQLWLYSPRSSYTLFFSKLLLCIVFQVIYQFILIGYFAFSMYSFGGDVYQQLDLQVFLTMVTFVFFLLIFYGLYLTCWVLFYWTLYHSLNRYPRIRSLRWLIIALIYFTYNILEALTIQFESVRQFIFRYRFNIQFMPQVNYDGATWNVYFDDFVGIPIIPAFYYVFLTGFLFYLSARLLTKKVEV